MTAAPEKLVKLRHLLAERFPTTTRAPGRVLPTGIRALDDATGGLPLSAITEVVASVPSAGSHLLLGELLGVTRAHRARVALVDSTNSFDPASFPADLLAHVIWARCAGTSIALNVADVFARDANLGLVVLDLRRAPAADLRRIPGPQWYRLQRAVEPTDLALVVITPRPSVPSAQVRFELKTSHPAFNFDCERPLLSAQLAPVLQRQRLVTAAAS